jgi:hypothetical protein
MDSDPSSKAQLGPHAKIGQKVCLPIFPIDPALTASANKKMIAGSIPARRESSAFLSKAALKSISQPSCFLRAKSV